MRNIFLTVLSVFVLLPACVDSDRLPVITETSNEFRVFMEKKEAGLQVLKDPRFGLIPSPVDNSHLLKQFLPVSTRIETKNATDPAYDLRDYNRVTSVKNQGSCGCCWAFTAMASVESSLMPGETKDLSENNLKNLHGFEWGHCSGGNADMAAAYFMRWNGPVNEADDPYSETNSSSLTFPAVKHVKNFLSVSSASISSVKEAVVEHGVVFTSMYHNDSYYNSGTKGYYYSGAETINHAISIVGWDDNYSKTNFNTPPSNNGAWIIKNSWGTGWGESG